MIQIGWRTARWWMLTQLLLGVLLAQSAQVTGRVTDPSGSIVPGVSITIKNIDTGVTHETTTNEAGYYTVPLLPPGKYSVAVQKEGFRAVNQTGVSLDVDQRASLDFTLQVGQVNQEISIQASAPLLNTVEPSIGQVIDNKRIVDLPLNGRDYATLALLSSGTAAPISTSRAGGFSSGGQRLSANNYLLDGADNNSIELADAGRSAELVKPSVDAIQEFKVQTNVYSAEFGHGTGAVVNVTIKSGTNAFHGTAFEFIRNEKLDAKNFFTTAGVNPPFKRNQYGGSIGGPIIKNHTFFFFDYEGGKIRQSSTTVSTLPITAERTGDFSALTAKRLTDPLTNQPFAGNIIPASRIDPTAARLAAVYPAVQNGGLTANYTYNGANNEDNDRFDVRIDHTFGSRDNLFGRVSRYHRILPAILSLPAPAFGGNAFDGTITGWNDVLGWNHIFSPSLIASTRVAWNYSQFTRVAPAATGNVNLNAQYGLRGVDTTTPGNFSDFVITGYRQLGIGQNNPVIRDSQNRQFTEDMTWIHGAHNIKFGVNILRPQNNILNSRGVVGSFTFNGQYTGDGFADFLLGWPSAYGASSAVNVNLRGWLLASYVQDDWKVTPRLTLNLGTRYEIARPFYDKQNRMSNFDLDTNPAQPKLVIAGSEGGDYDSRSLVNTSLNGWEPRIGLSYQVNSKTVVRSGYGIFRTYFEPQGDSQFLIGNPPFAYSVSLSGTNGTTKAPAFPLSSGAPPDLLSINNATGLSFSSYERSPHRAYAQQWNFNIQRQFGPSTLFEIGYSGVKGVHLANRIEGNFSPPGPGNLNTKRPIQSTLIPGTSVVASPLGPVLRHLWNGNSNYHALVTKVEQRLTHGFTVLSSFTYSKAIGDICSDAADGNAPNCGFQNPLNMRAERAVDNQDQTLRFVTSLLYEVPVGRGRRFGGSLPRLLDVFAGGWGVGGIYTASSGLPYSIVVSGNPANTGSTNVVNRPNVVGDPYAGERTLQQDFTTSAFAANGLYQYGNLGRNTMRARGVSNLDFIALKLFRVTEKVNVQFRFEAFNAANTPPFGAPNATLNTAGFGQITSAGAPRQLQFGLKIIF